MRNYIGRFALLNTKPNRPLDLSINTSLRSHDLRSISPKAHNLVNHILN